MNYHGIVLEKDQSGFYHLEIEGFDNAALLWPGPLFNPREFEKLVGKKVGINGFHSNYPEEPKWHGGITVREIREVT